MTPQERRERAEIVGLTILLNLFLVAIVARWYGVF